MVERKGFGKRVAGLAFAAVMAAALVMAGLAVLAAPPEAQAKDDDLRVVTALNKSNAYVGTCAGMMVYVSGADKSANIAYTWQYKSVESWCNIPDGQEFWQDARTSYLKVGPFREKDVGAWEWMPIRCKVDVDGKTLYSQEFRISAIPRMEQPIIAITDFDDPEYGKLPDMEVSSAAEGIYTIEKIYWQKYLGDSTYAPVSGTVPLGEGTYCCVVKVKFTDAYTAGDDTWCWLGTNEATLGGCTVDTAALYRSFTVTNPSAVSITVNMAHPVENDAKDGVPTTATLDTDSTGMGYKVSSTSGVQYYVAANKSIAADELSFGDTVTVRVNMECPADKTMPEASHVFWNGKAATIKTADTVESGVRHASYGWQDVAVGVAEEGLSLASANAYIGDILPGDTFPVPVTYAQRRPSTAKSRLNIADYVYVKAENASKVDPDNLHEYAESAAEPNTAYRLYVLFAPSACYHFTESTAYKIAGKSATVLKTEGGSTLACADVGTVPAYKENALSVSDLVLAPSSEAREVKLEAAAAGGSLRFAMTGAESKAGITLKGDEGLGTTDGTLLVPADFEGWVEVAVSAQGSGFEPVSKTVLVKVQAEAEAIAGGGRYETAAKVAQDAYPAGADGVIVATGANFPDALGASALAGVLDYPIVLTPGDDLDASAQNAIKALGAKHAVIVGGTAVVSEKVESQVEAIVGAGEVDRAWGEDRYKTAEAVFVHGALFGAWGNTAIIATGKNYPDALSVSGFAFANRAPIFLCDPETGLSSATKSALQDGGFDRIVIVGGEAVVSTDIEAWAYGNVTTLEENGVIRKGGGDRYETSKLIAQFVIECGGTANGACIATGANFPDALAGGPLVGRANSVLLLADPGNTGALDVLKANQASIHSIRFLGGDVAVPAEVRQAAMSRAGLA